MLDGIYPGVYRVNAVRTVQCAEYVSSDKIFVRETAH
jgi:hypothetical protein